MAKKTEPNPYGVDLSQISAKDREVLEREVSRLEKEDREKGVGH
ncbi:hypothetical protein [Nesterenkonia massiliensis]|nr:hypothetical protein [Nesterenkonia massiliensis]